MTVTVIVASIHEVYGGQTFTDVGVNEPNSVAFCELEGIGSVSGSTGAIGRP